MMPTFWCVVIIDEDCILICDCSLLHVRRVFPEEILKFIQPDEIVYLMFYPKVEYDWPTRYIEIDYYKNWQWKELCEICSSRDTIIQIFT